MFRFIDKYKTRKISIITEFTFIRLILSFASASFSAIWSLYLKNIGLTDSNIGFLAALLIFISLIISLFGTTFLEKIGEYEIFIISLLMLIASYIGFAFLKNIYFIIILAIISATFTVLRKESFSILFRNESNDNDLNKNEGFLIALTNAGWIFGPLLAGFVLAKYGFNNIFFLMGGFVTISLLIFLSLNIKKSKKEYQQIDGNIIKNIKDYFKNKKLIMPYLMTAGMTAWWGFIYVYMPIFIIENGYGAEIVGIFLAAVVIPLVILEYQIGKLSQEYGFKIFFIIGFLLLSIIAFSLYFITNMNHILTLLILASIPAAFIEPINESFFYKNTKKDQEEKYYPVYFTAYNIGGFIVKISIAIILLFLSRNYAYLTLSGLMLIFMLISLKIKN
jgi:MFS family permease